MDFCPYLKDSLLLKFRIILKPFHIQRRGMGQYIGGFSVYPFVLKGQCGKWLSLKEKCCCISADDDIEFVVHKGQFFFKPLLGTNLRRTPVSPTGGLSWVAMGHRYNIKIIRIIKVLI